MKKDDVTDVVQAIASLPAGDKALVLVPFRQHKNREAKEELNILLQKGFSRLYDGSEVLRIEDLMEAKSWKHCLGPGLSQRLAMCCISGCLVLDTSKSTRLV